VLVGGEELVGGGGDDGGLWRGERREGR